MERHEFRFPYILDGIRQTSSHLTDKGAVHTYHGRGHPLSSE